MIAEYSGRQVGTHLLVLFLHFISKSQRENSMGEASIKCEFLKFVGTISVHLASCLNVQNTVRERYKVNID